MRPLCPQVWPLNELRCPVSSKLKSSKRYPGVFTRSIKSRVDQKKDTHFYIRFRSNGKARKEMVGTQLRDGMTAYKASVIRSQRIHETIGKTKGSEKSQNFREIVQTFNSIFHEYLKHRQIKSIDQDTYRYQKHIQSRFGEGR